MTSQDIQNAFAPYIDCPIDVEQGWYQVVYDCLSEIRQITSKFSVGCIKEKFGGLRLYIAGLDDSDWDKVSSVISKYESKSLAVCEQCGRPGVLRANNWLKTLCNNHSTGKPLPPPPVKKDHQCRDSWNVCSECKLSSCTRCSFACYQCVDAWRHKVCAEKHALETKHEGHVNDLAYLLAQVGKDSARELLHGDN